MYLHNLKIGPVERCGESRNSTVSITEQSYRYVHYSEYFQIIHLDIQHYYLISLWISFGGVCQAYEGGSTLCDGEIGERVNIYINNTGGNTQSQLTSTLNAVTSVVFDTTSSRCQDLIRHVLCLYFYPPCGFNGTLTAPVSICPEECVYVQNECTNAWNQLKSLVSINLGFINCSNPGQILDPLPHCCVDAGITMDTLTSIPGHTRAEILFQNSDCMRYETLCINLYMYTAIFKMLCFLFCSAYKCIYIQFISSCNSHQPIPYFDCYNKHTFSDYQWTGFNDFASGCCGNSSSPTPAFCISGCHTCVTVAEEAENDEGCK